jgi:type II secretory pathway pseudopilin PulG
VASNARTNAAAPGRRRQRRGGGFTLTELLVVCGILAVAMGISAAALSRVGQTGAMEASERLVRSALMRARTSARRQSALTRVTFMPEDVAKGQAAMISLVLTRDAADLHFDVADGSRVLAGRNNWATLRGAKIEDGGVVRSCAVFDGGDTVVCDPAAGYDPTAGFSLAMYVWPDAESFGGRLVSYGESFSLDLTEDGGLVASLTLGEQGEVLTVETPPKRLRPGAWAPVGLLYDGLGITIRAHGVVEAARAERRRLLAPEEQDRLVIGGSSFRGRIDEFGYETLEVARIDELPVGVTFKLNQPVVVRFDVDGSLDPRVHQTGVTLPLRLEDEEREVRIDLAGLVR